MWIQDNRLHKEERTRVVVLPEINDYEQGERREKT